LFVTDLAKKELGTNSFVRNDGSSTASAITHSSYALNETVEISLSSDFDNIMRHGSQAGPIVSNFTEDSCVFTVSQ